MTYEDGRKHMLWLMAIGGAMRAWQHLDRASRQHSYFARAALADAANEAHHASNVALRILAGMEEGAGGR